jgi:hypothetical protein
MVRHGRVLSRDDLGATGSGPWPVIDADGQLIAVYVAHRADTLKPAVVLAS